MKSIKELKQLVGVKVLLRLDLNVPVKNGMVVDDFRIRKSLPTINFLCKKGAKVIIISHIETKPLPTLEPVSIRLKNLGINCIFIKNYKNALVEIEKSQSGSLILLENLRDHEGEKTNDRTFAKELASLADIYVNEGFSVSHREHASVCAITEFIPSYAGLNFEEEVKHLGSAFHPDHPFLFILAGAKFETKLPLIEKFMGIADKVYVGGALANNFFKEQGKETGKSAISKENFNLKRFFDNQKLLLPIDVVVVNGMTTVKKIDEISKDDIIYDAGPQTVKMLKNELDRSRYILWNGPLGAYEKGFKGPTLELAGYIAEATARGAKSILGGGDTLASIAELDLENKFTFVSTAGGAMLDFLGYGTLPGIKALEKGM